MIRNIVIGVLALVVAVGVYQYVNVWKDSAEKLKEANRQKEQLSESRKTLLEQVARLDSGQKELLQTITSKEAKIKEFDTQIAELKEKLVEANHIALVEISEQKIVEDFRRAYDQTEKNVRGIVIEERTKSGRFFANSFIAIATDVAKLATMAKNSEESLTQQVELNDQIRTLNTEISTLKDRNTELEKEKSQHYLKAYDEAYESFQLIHSNYVALLKAPPKVEFDLAPRWLQIVGGAVGGIAIGSLK